MTAFLGIIDCGSWTMRFCNASHCLPLHHVSRDIHPLDAWGLFLGAYSDIDYEEKEVDLPPGSRLFFYTDGITDARNHQRRCYGVERLAAQVARGGARPLSDVLTTMIDDVTSHTNGLPTIGDLTILGVKVCG